MTTVRKPVIEVRRSQRRRRTVSAYRDGGRIVVLIPARFSRAEEREWVDRMLERLDAREQRGKRTTDSELSLRAQRLAQRYLPDHPQAGEPTSVRWVQNQNGRWGSCTPGDRTIRLSARLRGMPEWVIDYVLLHELTHLVVPGHGDRFWALLTRYPRTERARGYLEGVAATAGLDLAEDTSADEPQTPEGDPA